MNPWLYGAILSLPTLQLFGVIASFWLEPFDFDFPPTTTE